MRDVSRRARQHVDGVMPFPFPPKHAEPKPETLKPKPYDTTSDSALSVSMSVSVSVSGSISLDPLAKAIGGLVPGLQWVGLGIGMDEPVWYETRRGKTGVSVRSLEDAEAKAIERALERLDVYE